jgi:F-type H+-transporting ATPase subunit b
MYLDASASIIAINGTWVLEVVSFLVMLAILWRWVYPPIAAAAERRQKIISDQLAQAERQAKEAEQRLKEAEAKLDDARAQAQEIIAGAARSAEQLREELKAKGEEEARRQVEKAVKDIQAARERAVEAVRAQVADIVIAVTEKVIGEALDVKGHKRLIDDAIKEVGVGVKR